MFGDIGHGFIMMMTAATLIMVEKKFPKGFGSEVSLYHVLS
jgi:V-type H+-transporting ATPase subunit a